MSAKSQQNAFLKNTLLFTPQITASGAHSSRRNVFRKIIAGLVLAAGLMSSGPLAQAAEIKYLLVSEKTDSDEKSRVKDEKKEDKSDKSESSDKPLHREKLTDEERRSAAVALNYSRASLHRIRRNPSVRVMIEEQEKILNHLDLNGVADEEVMKLYTAVLDEISQIQIADRERVVIRDRYQLAFQHDLGINAFEVATQAASANYVAAVRAGANSWWDYRTNAANHELDQWMIDKKRMTAVVDKSSQFLDVSWKMARCKQIPDRWLVRSDDLDKLEAAQRETDPAIRLRVLKRMEGFMECYPPYLYYVAKTQQSVGQLFAASETYLRLVTLGSGHFRKDEMLAAALANRALIQSFLSQPAAAETARQAMTFSSEAWEANLVCATVLQKHRQYEDAEDALLRNLDVNLERVQSRIALVGLYYMSDNKVKLIASLQDPEWVKDIPMQQLLLCAAKIGQKDLPLAVTDQLTTSLQGAPRFNLGRDDFVVAANPNWKIQNATVTLHWGDRTFSNPRITGGRDTVLLSFDGIAEFGSQLTWNHDSHDVWLAIKYGDAAPLKLVMKSKSESSKSHEIANLTLVGRRHPVYRIVSLEQNDVRVSFRHSLPSTDSLDTVAPVSRTTSKPVLSTPEDPSNDDSTH